LFHSSRHEVLQFTGIADYFVDDSDVAYQPCSNASDAEVYLNLIGPVLAFWYERSGRPALHGAVLGHQGKAIVLLGQPGAGKSTLALALLQQGWSLLDDDLAPLLLDPPPVRVPPTVPQLRVNLDAARHLLDDADTLPPVLPGMSKRVLWLENGAPGGFAVEPLRLAAIYILDRQPKVGPGPETIISRLNSQAALMALVKHSFVPRVVAALGWQPARLERLAQVVEQVPVKQLTYPGRLNRLPDVCARLLEDVTTRSVDLKSYRRRND
jgi:hypothetical protein